MRVVYGVDWWCVFLKYLNNVQASGYPSFRLVVSLTLHISATTRPRLAITYVFAMASKTPTESPHRLPPCVSLTVEDAAHGKGVFVGSSEAVTIAPHTLLLIDRDAIVADPVFPMADVDPTEPFSQAWNVVDALVKASPPAWLKTLHGNKNLVKSLLADGADKQIFLWYANRYPHYSIMALFAVAATNYFTNGPRCILGPMLSRVNSVAGTATEPTCRSATLSIGGEHVQGLLSIREIRLDAGEKKELLTVYGDYVYD